MKLWGGRFEKGSAKKAEKFTKSIYFDSRLAKYDVLGSIAHVRMLGKCGIIPKKDALKIINALNKVLYTVIKNKFKTDYSCEDIHTNIEKNVIKLAGIVGKKMHTARSRNDQIALDERMYLREEIFIINNLLKDLTGALNTISKQNKETVIPGFTHMQHAQPVKFTQYISAYISMFERDIERLNDCHKRVNLMPLGACALAGTSFPIDREYTAKLLGFSGIIKNTIDAVSDRDYIIEFTSVCAIISVHISRLSEEMVVWATKEFGFLEIDDAYATGSSIMPQKKNPDIFELLRGKTARNTAGLIGIITLMKGLPLAYNSDMQEDKVHLFSVIDNTKECVEILAEIMGHVRLNKENLNKAMRMDYSDATEIANYLVKKGVSFKDAHGIAGKLVLKCIKEKKDFKDLELEDFKKYSKDFEPDIYGSLKD